MNAFAGLARDRKAPRAPTAFDARRIREDFPILSRTVHGQPLVYLDNAATAQKPKCVIDALIDYYSRINANVHRGVHTVSVEATDAYETARDRVQRFIGAARREEVVFTRSTTEAVNLVAHSFARPRLNARDEILITGMEHHSNIVPWQILCEQTGAVLRVAPIDDDGELRLDEFERLVGPRTKLVAAAHASNALGTILPVEKMIETAHARGVPILLDGAQAVPHFKVDVRALDCDFYAFSSHKLFGPTGVGALYAKLEHLQNMPPYQGGGEMIKSVTFEKTTYNDVPHRFEAGTPNIAGAVGLGSAIDYVEQVGMETIADYEDGLLEYMTSALRAVPHLRMIGTARRKVALQSFVLEGVHAHDLGTILDREGIAVRTGHHCAQPVMDRFGVPATARASLAFYNTREEIDALVAGLNRVVEVFGL
jgi:cysteine desulfurase/selenocysteine lyase